MARKLTKKQKLWVEAYLETWNATEAARRAGYSGDENALAVRGSENVRKRNLRKEIDRRLAEAAMSANEVLARLSEQATASFADFFDKWGHPKWDEIRARGHLIKKVYRTKHGWRIELHDSQRALELLAKHHALLTDRIEVHDWRTRVIGLLQEGKLTPDEVRNELGDRLAEELFEAAGVRVSTG